MEIKKYKYLLLLKEYVVMDPSCFDNDEKYNKDGGEKNNDHEKSDECFLQDPYHMTKEINKYK